MEPLINIIVTIAVIFFVLKRMQEVAKKGGDLTKPPIPGNMFPVDEEETASRREAMFPEEEEAQRPEMASEEEETVSDSVRRERVRRAQEKLRERNRNLEERRRALEEQRRRIEERFEKTGDYTVAIEEYHAPTPTPVVRQTARPVRAGKPGVSPIPKFTRSSVVQSLIMGEILGPPVSLRTEDRLL